MSAITAFARYEYETGKAQDGTKILMIEFEDEDDESRRDPAGTWHVAWSNKTTVLPSEERTADNSRRLYFLLPPGAPVPPKVILTFNPSPNSAKEPQRLTLNPLPAIFAPDLEASARASGKKGVLHTIWAKKRLQVLEKEIKREEEFNLEGIALDLAKGEKEWIEKNFAVAVKPHSLDISSISKYPNGALNPAMASPRSPGGRKLSEKLRGLSLGTSDRDLAVRRDTANTPSHDYHPLSPDHDDVAYSSFQSFKQTPSTGTSRITAQYPPDHIRLQQSKLPTTSLDNASQSDDKDIGDELFAKSLSPRSPDDPKSPFSFSPTETIPYLTRTGEPRDIHSSSQQKGPRPSRDSAKRQSIDM
jgi:hypothetical protein